MTEDEAITGFLTPFPMWQSVRSSLSASFRPDGWWYVSFALTGSEIGRIQSENGDVVEAGVVVAKGTVTVESFVSMPS